LYRQLRAGTIKPVNEETSIQLSDLLIDQLEAAGYVHYEISNFCKPGCFSRHNTAYWTDQKYIGIGAAAHSYNHRSRQWNVASIPDYIDGITRGNPNFKIEILVERERHNDYILTHLRTMWGIQLADFREIFGEERFTRLLQQSKTLNQTGLMEQNEENLKITRKGLMVSDGIIRELIIN
jgi:oxygen-independent coproporphyrinogen-3 oxidase